MFAGSILIMREEVVDKQKSHWYMLSKSYAITAERLL
jgi:hypothetical protein